MVRKVVCGVFVLAVSVGMVAAEEYQGAITKVDGGKVTFVTGKFNRETKKLENKEEKTLPVADNVKVVKAKFNRETKKAETGEAVSGGLSNEMFSKIGEKGVRATIVTDSDNKKITEIRVFSFERGKGKGKAKNQTAQ